MFQDFLVKALEFEHPEDVKFVDIYKWKSYKSSIIVKLLIVDDKQSIFKKAKHLKLYNHEQKSFDKFLRYVFITA